MNGDELLQLQREAGIEAAAIMGARDGRYELQDWSEQIADPAARAAYSDAYAKARPR